ncbi:beta-amylase 1, chloroplastic isoform X2 [Cajanus cajan]|uniref:Beta-amylase n=1 Tax=Cajanus cajan TaxID=3821 RepID=A0A151RIK2_CAJCA|nr:beta-amylase 1, chloroplastic isoform X2 [Cajanus cajan]KYP42323.1 Beta-amylase [Cajanus cajan]
MAILSQSTASFSPSFVFTRSDSTRFPCHVTFRTRSSPRRVAVSSRLNSSKSPGAGGSLSPDNGDVAYELHHDYSPQRCRNGSPVFVTMPVKSVGPEGRVARPKTIMFSLKALASAGVEGVVIEIWWGLVEKNEPRAYDWRGYEELFMMACKCGLKVRVVLAFHQHGTGPDDPNWIPLPLWVLDEIQKDVELAYCDRFGRRNIEYISLGCDILPVLRGRSPVQVYADFMRDFRDSFRNLFGVIITGVQIGMGPGGELRYPSFSSQEPILAWSRELGEFQCYDKYMLASLNASARNIGKREWGNGGPVGAGSLMQNPEHTDFFKNDGGSWNTPYGKFFLEWYSDMLLLHGERICREAEAIFRGIEVHISAKLAAIHWHYILQSHPSELTAGYYNTFNRDGYLPFARLFSKYGFSMCCSCFEMQDEVMKKINPDSSPEGFLRQLLLAARLCDISLEGQNFSTNLDDGAFSQVLKMSKFYSDGIEKRPFSFNFVRMDKRLFEFRNWDRFTRFVRQMSDGNIFRARLNAVGDIRLKTTPGMAEVGLLYHLYQHS